MKYKYTTCTLHTLDSLDWHLLHHSTWCSKSHKMERNSNKSSGSSGNKGSRHTKPGGASSKNELDRTRVCRDWHREGNSRPDVANLGEGAGSFRRGKANNGTREGNPVAPRVRVSRLYKRVKTRKLQQIGTCWKMFKHIASNHRERVDWKNVPLYHGESGTISRQDYGLELKQLLYDLLAWWP